MMDDWKDMLARLRSDVPQVEEPAEDADARENPDSNVKESAKKELIHIVVEKKGRKGKTATIAEGFKCSDYELQEIASKAKRHLGTGGSARGGEILIQGECRERFAAFLRNEGFGVRF